MTKEQEAAEAALDDQTQRLPKRKLYLVYATLSFALMVSFMDQNAVAVLQPSIARDLNAEATASWAGTAALIANTTCQVLYGRLGDLYGRKKIMIFALFLLLTSNIGCGRASTSAMLFAFRACAGAANGGIMALTQQIVSDIVSLKERGKYQGILGAMTGVGNALGPLIGAAFAVRGTWRSLFYVLAALCFLTILASWAILPSKKSKRNFRDTIAIIDFKGLVTGATAVTMLLNAISQGGHAGTEWNSPVIISMFVTGGICLVTFVFIEWKWAKLPMMPLHIFNNRSVAAMFLQTFLLGIGYITNLFFLPLYLQNVRGKSALASAVLQLPLVVAHASFSIGSGYLQSWLNRYMGIIWFGFGIMTVGAGLLTTCGENTHLCCFCFYLVLIGTGTGCVWQTTLVALQAHCSKANRAVVIANRNVIRNFGAGIGLAASSAILSNAFKASLPPDLAYIAENTFALPDVSGASPAFQAKSRYAYASAIRTVFYWCPPLMGVCFLLCWLINDNGLERSEDNIAWDELSDREEKDPSSSTCDLESAGRRN